MGNWKHQVQEIRANKSIRFAVHPPQVIAPESLLIMNDDELLSTYRAIETDREVAYTNHYDTQMWDVELAYIKREQQTRRDRRVAHEAYLRAVDEEAKREAQREFHLPPMVFTPLHASRWNKSSNLD